MCHMTVTLEVLEIASGSGSGSRAGKSGGNEVGMGHVRVRCDMRQKNSDLTICNLYFKLKEIEL
jgi:hypothetical protein